MRQVSSLVAVGLLAFTLYGCSGEGEQGAQAPASPAASPAPVAASPAAAPAPKPAAKPAAKPATKPGEKPAAKSAASKQSTAAQATTQRVAGLIPSTNGDERIRRVRTGRTNPFSVVAIPATPEADKKPDLAKSRRLENLPEIAPTTVAMAGIPIPRRTTALAPASGSGRTLPGFPGRNRIATRSGAGTTSPGASSTSTTDLANPGASTPEALPPLPPEPTLARAIAVTGVVTIAGIPQAIVKAPDEPTSRSVRVGQRLSNGQVLVKRIEIGQGSDPVVILEQYGIEVAKTVGEPPAAPPTGRPAG